MTEICLVRHGQTDWNLNQIVQGREDIPLNANGRQQAKQSAELLSKEKWDIIISSPLIRAQETAEIIAEKVGVATVSLDERFVERNFGTASGKPIPTVRGLIANEEAEGMEKDKEMINRCYSAFQDIANKYRNMRVIIVAHSHTIKGILCGIKPEEFTFRTQLDNACANYIQSENNQFKIVRFNVSEHIVVK